MFGIGPMELMAILVVALLVFGPKRIPELARTVGRGLAEFRRASNDLRQSLALDELQQDLRRELDPNQTIHRPKDRPAQAGDGDEPPIPTKPTTTPNETDDGRDEAVAKEATASSSDAGNPHPGELPLGDAHDYEHRDADEVSDRVDKTATKPLANPTTSTSEPTSGSETPPRHENHSADSQLGNVPVSGTKPTDSQRG
jgi:TatA/E family protein of Tat protein translocase